MFNKLPKKLTKNLITGEPDFYKKNEERIKEAKLLLEALYQKLTPNEAKLLEMILPKPKIFDRHNVNTFINSFCADQDSNRYFEFQSITYNLKVNLERDINLTPRINPPQPIHRGFSIFYNNTKNLDDFPIFPSERIVVEADLNGISFTVGLKFGHDMGAIKFRRIFEDWIVKTHGGETIRTLLTPNEFFEFNRNGNMNSTGLKKLESELNPASKVFLGLIGLGGKFEIIK